MDIIMNKMVDIHNHSLPLVDDGAKSFEAARANIEYLKSHGIDSIVLTSHYIVESDYNANVEARRNLLEKLRTEVADLDIKLYLGNEVFITDSNTIKRLLQEGEITTLNGSRYMLIEFPLRQKLQYMENVICDLNEMGIVPIIAHPERYTFIQNDFSQLENILEYDCLLQCNLSSIIGNYGSSAKKLMKKLLKEQLVTFIATDFHRVGDVDKVGKSLKKLKKFVGEEYVKMLTYENPLKVLENDSISRKTISYK